MLNQQQLKKHLPLNCLPKELGGTLNLEHDKWINHCLEQIKLLNLENNLDSLENLNDLNKSFMFNCDLIGENISSFDADDTDENDEFCKNSSELDLSGLSEQLTGLCDKLTNNFEQDLGIKQAQDCGKLVDLEANNKEDELKNNLQNANNNENSNDKPNSNDQIVVVKPSLSNRTSLTIMKPKPENIPITKLNCDQKLKNNLIKVNSNGYNGSLSVEEDDYLRLFRNYLINNDKSLHLKTDPGMTLNEFIIHLRTKGRKGLFDEYSQLRHMKDLNFIFNNQDNLKRFSKLKGSLRNHSNGVCNDQNDVNKSKETNSDDNKAKEEEQILVKSEESEDSTQIDLDNLDSRLSDKFNDLMGVFSYESSLQKNNLIKNRYTDVLCYDHSRVQLKIKDEDDFDDIIEEEPVSPTDYINANWVDGYEQKRAFISTQGPLSSTCLDFWEMCIQNDVIVIVMTTRTTEGQRIKCSQYWPFQENSQLNFSYLTVINNGVEENADYTITKLTIKDNSTKKEHKVTHMQFLRYDLIGFNVKFKNLKDKILILEFFFFLQLA